MHGTPKALCSQEERCCIYCKSRRETWPLNSTIIRSSSACAATRVCVCVCSTTKACVYYKTCSYISDGFFALFHRAGVTRESWRYTFSFVHSNLNWITRSFCVAFWQPVKCFSTGTHSWYLGGGAAGSRPLTILRYRTVYNSWIKLISQLHCARVTVAMAYFTWLDSLYAAARSVHPQLYTYPTRYAPLQYNMWALKSVKAGPTVLKQTTHAKIEQQLH